MARVMAKEARAPQSTDEAWTALRQMVNRAFSSSLHSAVATVDGDGAPVVTPIGSLILRHEPGRAFFFPLFANGLVQRLSEDPRVSILSVDSRFSTWAAALALGRFRSPVGVRMRGRADGPVRKAEREEELRWLRRVRAARFLPGHAKLWSRLDRVQDLIIESAEPIGLGTMTGDSELHWRAD